VCGESGNCNETPGTAAPGAALDRTAVTPDPAPTPSHRLTAMSERPVLRYGNPLLHQVSAPVTDFAPAVLRPLLADLWDTMEARGGVGIAAPQIGEFQRIVVFGMEHSLRYPDAPPIPRTVLINPVIEPLDDAREDGWEGCLSVPGLRGLVPRFARIRYSGRDETGAAFTREVDGFHARVVQHECDHLDGILYPMRIRDLREFGFEDELARTERC
jgi:peptide deformylase